ncbi:carbon-nitrogen hydrolase family protein [Euzebya pacifica]|jgi:nitrilase|uniref:carbon-nitrogen hydrolase family protein n=1 Tax=Euzebya pacifica TaxID=1608957 RepID=UPI0030F84830
MRIAAAQTRPAWGDSARTTTIVTDWIQRAATTGVDLLAFGETFLSGYPFWVSPTDGGRFDDPDQAAAYAYYLDAAVELDGPEVDAVAECVADTGVFTYLGITERGGGSGRGTVWCTLLAISPRDGVVSAHRKLRPTFEERLVWGSGDGNGLRVHDTGHGIRVGGLNCWENWMPQARHALYAAGEDLHVSVWPGGEHNTHDIPRFLAKEGRVVSLAASAVLELDDIPDDFPLLDRLDPDDVSFNGGSAIAGPDGRWLAEPLVGREGFVVADIDPATIRAARHTFDATGHYSRPDIFSVTVDRRRQTAATFLDDPRR